MKIGNLRGICWCDEHAAGAPYQIDEHVYVLETRTTYDENGHTKLWRWTCSCSSVKAGSYTRDGANAAYHHWLHHVDLMQRRRR